MPKQKQKQKKTYLKRVRASHEKNVSLAQKELDRTIRKLVSRIERETLGLPIAIHPDFDLNKHVHQAIQDALSKTSVSHSQTHNTVIWF